MVNGPIVYRLGRHPFTVQRGVRFPLGLCDSALVAEGRDECREQKRGCSSAWLECRSVTPEVAGSSPVSPARGLERRTEIEDVRAMRAVCNALVVKLVDTPS